MSLSLSFKRNILKICITIQSPVSKIGRQKNKTNLTKWIVASHFSLERFRICIQYDKNFWLVNNCIWSTTNDQMNWMCVCVCMRCVIIYVYLYMWTRVFINWNLCNLFEAKIKIQHMQTNCRYANITSIILNIYGKRILNTNICMWTCTDFSTVYYSIPCICNKKLYLQCDL